MIKIKIAFGLILIPTVLMSKELLTNTGNRGTTSLYGSWNYLADLPEKGYLNFYTQVFEQKNPDSTSACYNTCSVKIISELVKLDFDKSITLIVPND